MSVQLMGGLETEHHQNMLMYKHWNANGKLRECGIQASFWREKGNYQNDGKNAIIILTLPTDSKEPCEGSLGLRKSTAIGYTLKSMDSTIITAM